MKNTQICIISSQNSYENNEKNIIKSIKDEYTNNMIDLETINETNNNLIEPIIEFKSNYLKSVQEDENKKEKKMYNDYKQELEDILFSSDIEWGIYSEFDKFVMEHVEDEYLMKAINDIYVQNCQNEEVLMKILNAISEVEYEKVYPFGQITAIAAVSNKSLAVQQKGIEAFERWKREDSIAILENLDIKENWLKKYVEKIINNVKSVNPKSNDMVIPRSYYNIGDCNA